MEISKIIEIVQEDIRRECSNPADYDGYVDNCLLFDVSAAADWYNVTVEQIKYICSRALLSI